MYHRGMSFEFPDDRSASDIEDENTLLDPESIVELGGPIHERLAPLFSISQITEFQTMLRSEGVTLQELGNLSEPDAIKVSTMAADIFELDVADRKEKIEEIAAFEKNRKKKPREEIAWPTHLRESTRWKWKVSCVLLDMVGHGATLRNPATSSRGTPLKTTLQHFLARFA